MVEYADYHVLLATLSPIFLAASITAHYRWGSSEKKLLDRIATFLLLGANIMSTVSVLIISLLSLGGFLEISADRRISGIVLLLFQLLISVGLAIRDARSTGSAPKKTLRK
jgi:hypothetical protein